MLSLADVGYLLLRALIGALITTAVVTVVCLLANMRTLLEFALTLQAAGILVILGGVLMAIGQGWLFTDRAFGIDRETASAQAKADRSARRRDFHIVLATGALTLVISGMLRAVV